MKGEIDKDFYCSGDYFTMGDCCLIDETDMSCITTKCSQFHRKHPTPEQYEEKYGEKYPDDGAVYAQPFEDQTWDIFS